MSSVLPVDPGLLVRLREAYAAIRWEPASDARPSPSRTVRTARLHDETARVETWGPGGVGGVAVTAGPVGALVLLLEIDRRGRPTGLGARNAGSDPAFPEGAILAVWSADGVVADSRPNLSDLVELARYALP